MKRVLVFGTFDGLHPGHLDFFAQARKYGDFLIAVVGRDETVKIVKGKLPVMNESKRLEAVRNSGAVDEARLGNAGDPYAVIKEVNPDVIALGYDQNSFTTNLAAKLDKAGLNVRIVRLMPYFPETYHSRLLNK